MIYIDLSTSWKSFHVFFWGGGGGQVPDIVMADWGLGGLGLGGECEKNHPFPIPPPTKMIRFFWGILPIPNDIPSGCVKIAIEIGHLLFIVDLPSGNGDFP